jgi:hypothetical protein
VYDKAQGGKLYGNKGMIPINPTLEGFTRVQIVTCNFLNFFSNDMPNMYLLNTYQAS